MKKYVIIGNGCAGATALSQIRRKDKEGSIVVFTRESHPFYYRPRLPEYLTGEMGIGDFTMQTLSQYKEWGVDIRFGESVIAVDAGIREVTGDKQGVVRYDELLLASGANCFLPPVKGNDKKGVFTLRTVEDADALAAAAGKAKNAILVGGGLLGLEAGRALVKLGLKVDVVEFMDRLLPRQLDHQGAALLQKQLEGMGFAFHLSAKAQEVSGDDGATGLDLEGGKHLEGGIVLFSAGVRPNLELARLAGVACDKAVKVDGYMMTSVPGIWAAGDATEFNGQPSGLWPVALAQGKAAGLSMAGELTAYVPQASGTSLKVLGIDLVSSGNIDAEKALPSKCFANGSVYRKVVLEGDVIKGIIFLGSTAGANDCIDAMNKGKHLGPLAGELDREGFDFSRLR